MILQQLLVAFGINVNQNSVKQAMNTVQSIRDYAKKALGAIGIGFSFSSAKSMASLAESVQQIEKRFKRIFTNADTGKGWAKHAKETMQDAANYISAPVETVRQSYMDIAVFAKTAGMGIKESADFSGQAIKACGDAAAFLNKDLANTVFLMKSLMRGNTMMAQRMGLSITAEQQEAKAVEMYNVAFKELNETQRKWVMLRLYENAIKEAGGLGAAAENAGTFSDELDNLTSACNGLKVAIGEILLPYFTWGTKQCAWAVNQLKDAFKLTTGETGAWSGMLQSLRKVIGYFDIDLLNVKRSMQGMQGVISWFWNKFIQFLGGEKNAKKFLSVILGILTAMLGFKGVVSVITNITSAVMGLAKAFGVANVSAGIIFAVLVALALIVEDFVGFLEGKKSFIGKIFESMGIGADDARKGIIGYVKEIIKWFSNLIDRIRAIYATSNNLFEALGKLAGMGVVLIIKAVFKLFTWIFTHIPEIFAFIMSAIGSFFSAAFEVIVAALKVIIGAIVEFWTALIQEVMNALEQLEGGFEEGFHECADIVNKFIDDVGSYFSRLISDAMKWGSDMIDNFINGIKNKAGELYDTVKDIGKKIADNIGFSVPKEGPMSKADKWMPDMIDLMAGGLNSNKGKLLDAVTAMAGDMGSIMRTASAATATAAVSSVSNRSTTINQNVDIKNSYSGGTTETQRNISKAMNQSANDATAAMARGLAYSV